MVRKHVQEDLNLLVVWRTYLASFIAAGISSTIRFLQVGAIESTLLGGIIFLLVIIPSMVFLGAIRSSDVTNIQGYFSDVKSLSPFVKLAIRYFRLFEKWKQR